MHSIIKVLVVICACDWLMEVESLNILGIFPVPAKSHYFVFEPYLKELAIRGHNLTVISYYPQKESLLNFTDISLAEDSSLYQISHPISDSYLILLLTFTILNSFGGPIVCRLLMQNEDVQNLLTSETHYELVILEQFNSDCGLAIAHKFNAPVIGISSHMILPTHYQRYGIPYNPSYVLFDFITGGTRPTFFQRLQRIFLYNYLNFINYYVSQRLENNIVAEYIPNVPPLEELGRNIKLILAYQNFMLSGPSILPPNVIEIGGIHVANLKQLPEDLREFIENSKHGVIYISFGSILKASSMPKDKLQFIIDAMEELPQRVIWKWDRNRLPGNPKNIMVSKWLPQNDILGHPNVVAFFSHCGLLGVTEALYHGVPVIGMPVYGDQPSNAAAIEESGLGVQISLSDLSKDLLLEKIRIIMNPTKNVKMLSKAWHDRPIKAMDNAIFWTEFTARNQNITLRPLSADVPLYQYFCLDVILVLLLILFINIAIIKYLFKIVMQRIFKVKIDKKKTL